MKQNVPHPIKSVTRMKLWTTTMAMLLCTIFTFDYSYSQNGAALVFDGNDDIVNVGSAITPMLNGTNTLTVEAWVNASNTTGTKTIVCNHQGAGFAQFDLRIVNNTFDCFVGFGTYTVNAGTVVPNTWQYVAMVFDGITLKLYVNGALVGTTSTPSYILPTGNAITTIGNNGYAEKLEGQIDEVRIWNRALTFCEIENNRNAELPAGQIGLLSYYKFNQGIASGTNTGINTLTDSSGNANTGTLTTFALTGAISNWIAPGGVVTGTTATLFQNLLATTWTSRTSAADNLWNSVTYGNGLFVAVADTGTGNRVMTSPDGITWTSRTSAADNQWFSVTYGNGLFVAVARSGIGNRVMTSSDGITWTSRTSAADNFWRSVTYGNGLFVAVADSGIGNRVMTSPDGITWTSQTSVADNAWYSVTYGNGLFVAVSYTGTGNRVMTSPDGTTWTSRTSAADNGWRSVTYGNGLFVAVSITGSGNRVMTSPDGITWTSQTSAADNFWISVTYGNGLFVAVSSTGTGNRVMTSPDGITWTSRTSAADNAWLSVTYGNGLFVAVSFNGAGNRVMTSPDGITWTSRSSAADNQWRSVTYGNGLFVAVAQSGTGNRVMTSPDGITWTSRTSTADNQWFSVTYGNGLFVAVSINGTSNRVMTSPDGITWTSRTSASDNGWYSVIYGNGLFVAVSYTGTGNRVMTSSGLVTPTFTAVAPICSGATLSALPTSSNNGIIGTWSPALNNLATTNYTFTPTAGLCATTATLTITVNPNVTPTFTAVAPICSGATLSALPTSSNNGIAGAWSPALNNLATTTYTFTPTAGVCATVATLTVTVNPNVTPTFTAVADICSGATLSALPTSSNNGIAGAWSPALNNLATTTYTFTPTAGVCAIVATLTVTVNPNVTPPTAIAIQNFCSGATVANIASNGIGVQWYNVPTGGTPLPNTTVLTAGNYFCTSTISECESASRTEVTVVFPATTWDGLLWSHGLPDLQTRAIFAGNYTAPTNLTACSVSVSGTANVVFPTNTNFTVYNEIIVGASSTLVFESDSNLIQINPATNTGNIVYKRNTAIRRLEYTYWSSPVANQNLLSFTPNTLVNRFYTYNEPTKLFVQVASPSTTNFEIAKGYALRAPNNYIDAPAAAQSFVGIYTGVPNNGNITIPVTFTASPTGGDGYNLVGNPYPSTVSGTAFLNANAGSMYFWTHKVLNAGFSNYATFNLSGAAAATAGGVGALPNGFIQAGQGFMFLTTTSKNVTFTNAMREVNNAGQFFRTAQTADNNKLWLNLSNNDGAFSQTMIAYLPNTTTAFDDGYDAKQINNGNVLSSKIANDNYAIQSRGNFVNTDVVKLNLNIATAGNYTLSKDNTNGIFSGNQDFFLRDNLLGTTHNIKQSPYNFVAEAGNLVNRFEIVYQATLSNNNNIFDNANVIVFEQNRLLNVSATDDLKSVKIFDIQGRNIFETSNINAKTAVLNTFRAQQQILMVQITNANNDVVTKKVIF